MDWLVLGLCVGGLTLAIATGEMMPGAAAMVLGVLMGVTLFIWRAIDDEPSPQLREQVGRLEDVCCHVCGTRFTAEEPLILVSLDTFKYDEMGYMGYVDNVDLAYACETTCLPQVRERILRALPDDLRPDASKIDAASEPVA